MKHELDLVNGSLFKSIFIFSLPLMFSNILIMLFNIADISIVGKFGSTYAIGSVGSTSMFIWLFTGFIGGVASAGNVLVAFYVGAKKSEDVKETVYNSFVFCLFFGILSVFIGFFACKPVLNLLNTKPELLSGAIIYFKIYILGFPATAIYNFGCSVLSAIGDTRRPLIYLSVAGIINVLLDLLFVCVFYMGVEGVAAASCISQWISAVCVLCAVLRGTGDVKLTFRKQKLNLEKLLNLGRIGVPAGLQSCIFAVANMFIQSGVNSFSPVVVAGCTAADKADALNYSIMGGFYSAGAAFIGQNYGAKKKSRILKSFFISTGYAVIVGFIFGGAMLLFGRQFISIFTNDLQVIDAGMSRLRIMALSYWLSSFMDGAISASRGLGKTTVPTVIVILGSCVFRIIWIYTVFAYFQTIPSLFLLYAFSWAITAFVEILYFAKLYRKLDF